MRAKLLTGPVIKMLAVAGVVVGFIIYINLAGSLPRPTEANRVTSRAGFSIIVPEGYESTVASLGPGHKFSDTIEIIPPSGKTMKQSRIFVGRFRSPPDLELIRARDQQVASEFQGSPAYVFVGETKREFYWRAVIPRGDSWYELVLWQPIKVDFTTTDWWPYVLSFRAPESAATMPTPAPTAGTRPATNPQSDPR